MLSQSSLTRISDEPPVIDRAVPSMTQTSAVKTVISDCVADLARIYEDDVNLCLVQRSVPPSIEVFVNQILHEDGDVQICTPVDTEGYDFTQLWPQYKALPGYQAWLADVRLLVDAFCELFGQREVGLRLRTLNSAMCPRFHVDWVTVRLICCYGGLGTEWLPNDAVDRGALGVGGSGRIPDQSAIRHMPAYAVGLMKGERWEGNEGRGLVHRSPAPTAEQPRRLLLTLDML